MYFSERILWHTSKAVQCWLVLEWFHFVICHLYGVIRTIIKSFLYIYTHQYLYTCIVIVCEHGLRIVICCALSNKELLLLLFEPFVSTFVHENRGVVMAMIVCSHVSLIHTHVKLDTILYKYSLSMKSIQVYIDLRDVYRPRT